MKKIIFTLTLFFVLFCSCHSKTPVNTQNIQNASNAINSFDEKLFSNLCNSNENVNYSAISIYSLLYALQNGADGETSEQIKSAIGAEDSEEFLNQMQAVFRKTENMSNSIWYQKSLKLTKMYTDFLNKCNFQQNPTDFTKAAKTRKTINSFISDKTNKMIENFLSQDLDISTRLVLLNTLYFNQKWENPFENSNTYNENFYTKNGEQQVPMMHRTGNYFYSENDDFQAVQLDYKNYRYSMIIFLPKENDYDFSLTSPAQLMNDFSKNYNSHEVELTLPKFDLTTKYELTPVLQSLGIHDAFSAKADLSKIFTNAKDLFVDTVLHQVRITVNEKETKAAAVTMVGVKATAFMPKENFIFKADHPFVYIIRDNELNVNLFTGIINNPIE